MKDKTTIGNTENAETPSKAFREYIKSLVGEIVINNAVFNDHKKYLQHYSQEEGVNYTSLEKNLTDLFEAFKDLKSHKSNSLVLLVKKLAKDCYLEESTVDQLVSAINKAQVKEDTERRPKVIKPQEPDDKAKAVMKGSNKKQEADMKTLELLKELKKQLQIYLDNQKRQTAPVINPVNTNWSAVFIEQLRQAYCRKDLAFLENAFSSKAQIMTGAFEKNGNCLRYRKQGKQQYMANLKYIFEKNKTINVNFGTDNLTGLLYASADGRCQVIRLLQVWNSDNYSDTGYLFLVLYADQNGPKVYIRAWQPQFVNGRHITVQELNGLNNVTGLI